MADRATVLAELQRLNALLDAADDPRQVSRLQSEIRLTEGMLMPDDKQALPPEYQKIVDDHANAAAAIIAHDLQAKNEAIMRAEIVKLRMSGQVQGAVSRQQYDAIKLRLGLA